MKKKSLMALLLSGAGLLASCSGQKQAENTLNTMQYPLTDTVAHTDEYFGTTVADPFRWLEDDMSEQTADWVKRQNEVTDSYLAQIPFRQQIRDRLEQLYDYEKYSAPSREGDYYYFAKNDGLQNQSVLYRQKGLDGEPEVFIDPNKFAEDGTIAYSGGDFSQNYRYFAYLTSESGSDWRKIYVMDVESKQLLTDTIDRAKFTGVSWKGDEGFYYSTYDAPEGSELSAMNMYHKVYFHKLGTPQSEDEVVFGGEELGARYVGAFVTEDNKYLLASAAVSTSGNALYAKRLDQPGAEWIPMVGNYDNEWSYVHNEGDKFYFQTDYKAPNQQVLAASFGDTDPDNWEVFISEKENMLRGVGFAGGNFFLNYLQDATTRIYQHSTQGQLVREVKLPALGSAGGFNGKKDDTELFYTFTSFTFPPTIYRYDIASGESGVFRKPQVDFDPEAYETKQVFYTSKDGTKVPMFIVHRKGLPLNGQNPAYLYSYGGFNISLTPSFSTSRIFWLEQGGVFAMPNIRGGGEYGKEWHTGGTKMQKQNVFDDFIAAAEYLKSEGYTSTEKLGIYGGSNGGLLVGATMTQRPDLCAVAVPAVGVLDMLRYHKFTAGAGWIYDYGCADSSQAMFEYLYNYSPVHNVKQGTEYPATLVTTADHDDRVVPAHSFKFISELQRKHTGSNPVLIRIETKAGHGAGKPTSKLLDEQADVYAFSLFNMGEQPFSKETSAGQ